MNDRRNIELATETALRAGASVSDIWDAVARGADAADYGHLAASARAAADASAQG